MSTTLIAAIIAGSLLGSVFLGMRIRSWLPEHHLSADTKDTVKLAMGLVATMTALVLGLLVSSAKGSYDTTRGEVIQMAAKVAFLDRVLTAYGPDASNPRAAFRQTVEQGIGQMWSEEPMLARFAAHTSAGDAVYAALQGLTPKTDTERSLKAQALAIAVDLAQLRTLITAQAVPSVSMPLLVVVVAWLFVIFLSFSLLAPPNATAALSLAIAALSVSGAILLILELDRPLGGFIQVSSQPLANAIALIPK